MKRILFFLLILAAMLTWAANAQNTITLSLNVTQNITPNTTYNFYDSGGSDDVYSTNQNSTATLTCVGGHTIEYTLIDSYGDGWNGNAINIEDACGVIETLTIENGSSISGTLNLCEGDYYKFTWQKGSYSDETSFTLSDNGVTLYLNQEGSDLTDGQVLHTIGTAPVVTCAKPTDLTAGTPGTNSVELSWTENGSATTWDISTGNDESPISITSQNVTTDGTTFSYTLTGLNADADYTVKVRANCGTEQSCWSDAISFTTAETCARPTDLAEDNISFTTADLSWTGSSNSYVLQYRPWYPASDDIITTGEMQTYTVDLSEYEGIGSIAIRHYDISDMFQLIVDDIVVTNAQGDVVYSQDFESCEGNIPAEFFNIDLDGDGYTWKIASSSSSNVNGSYGIVSESYNNDIFSPLFPDNWLILSEIQMGGQMTFQARGQAEEYASENFAIYVSSESSVVEIQVNTNTYDVSSLTSGTPYAWQVKGICDEEESNWVTSFFNTKDDVLIFATDGNWNDLSNWTDMDGNPTTVLPTIDKKVRVDANAIIPANVVATSGKTTINGGSITIKDGGQLKHSSATLPVTMEKEITGYGAGNEEANAQYYIISTPFSGATELTDHSPWSYVSNLNEGTYDLYAFDPTSELAWINYEHNYTHDEFVTGNYNLGLVSKKGYLYGNEEDRTVTFSGTTFKSVNNTISETYEYSATADEFNGWKLVGNPFACNAYLNYVDANGHILDADFYIMNASDNGFVKLTSPVVLPPLTGALMKVDASGKIQFSTEPLSDYSGSLLSGAPCLPPHEGPIQATQAADQDASCPTPLCPEPSNIHVVDGTLKAHSVTITWEVDNSGELTATSFNYTLTNLTSSEETSGTTTSNSVALTDLDASTEYNFMVASICGEQASDYPYIDFTTADLCSEPFVLTADNPFVENFDGEDFEPDCWGNEGWVSSDGTAMAAGDNSVRALTTPRISLPTEGTAMLSFKSLRGWLTDNSSDEVLVYRDNGDNSVLLSVDFNLEDTWENITLNLSEFAGYTVRIAFRYYDSDPNNFHEWYIDDITISILGESDCGITQLPSTWTFEQDNENTATVAECWTLAKRDKYNDPQYDPQVLNQAYYANSGSASLKLDGEGLFAMPEFKVDETSLKDITLELYVRQYSENCKLRVGVMTNANDPGSFTPLTEISNNGASGQQRHFIDFSQFSELIPEDAKFIAFRNIYNGNWGRSINYLDDIKLSLKQENNCGISQLPSTWTFEQDDTNTAKVAQCWTLANRDGYNNDQYDPTILNQAYYANNSQACLRLDGRCLYAMPQINVNGKTIADLTMELFVRQYSVNCKLLVGVMTDANDPGSFTPLAEISNNGASGQQKHFIDFSLYSNSIPAEAKFIAFRNVYNGTWGRSINYIDDINIDLPLEQPGCGITNLPSVWTFEQDDTNTAKVAECWTLANRDGYSNEQYDPTILNQPFYSNNSQACLKLDGRCLYAMPQINVSGKTIADLTMELSVRQYSVNCKLLVGVMTDANNPDSFRELAVISNNGTVGHQAHVIDFSQYSELIPENAKFIAFRNVYNGTWGRSINYLDDINIFVTGSRALAGNGVDLDFDNDFDFDTDFALSPLGVDEFDISDFTVYPNPTTGLLTLGMEAQRVEVTSLTGQKVALFENTSSIDIANLPAGVYILKATLPQGTAVRKVVKR